MQYRERDKTESDGQGGRKKGREGKREYLKSTVWEIVFSKYMFAFVYIKCEFSPIVIRGFMIATVFNMEYIVHMNSL